MPRRWSNPYISKVQEEQRYILPFIEFKLSPSESEELQRKVSSYQRLILELGIGSGTHLIELAKRNPEALCAGFELRYKRIFSSAKRALSAGVDNVILLRTDASRIDEFFAPRSVDAVYVNFPDPWAKKGWLKNRLLNERFIDKLDLLLKPDGVFEFKSDHLDYFYQTLKKLEADPRFKIERSTYNLHSSEWSSDNILTEFERLFISKGIKINYLRARR